jgi:UDP-2,4-diacetamido-2,4,6-trideoxy-beta-L-altropyranose hydrolase
MNIVFRTDASLQIGNGHVMRCLALANALSDAGASCTFICRTEPGHLVPVIREQGHEVICMPPQNAESEGPLFWENDAATTKKILGGRTFDWMVLDHYALDQQYEAAIQSCARRRLVIDDLANREHLCDILIDPNLGRVASDYKNKIPTGCALYVGPRYALLRVEFMHVRNKIHGTHTKQENLKKLLISMGGADAVNATSLILQALRSCNLPSSIMGAHSPWLHEIERIAQKMPCATKVLINASNMAELMQTSDLAIGASGGTSWERCCVGLPSVIVTVADNQILGAKALEAIGAAIYLGGVNQVLQRLPNSINNLISKPSQLIKMREAAFSLTEGDGCFRAVEMLKA